MDKQLRALSDLRVWERNYNEGDIGAISTSIAMFGFNRTIAVWRDGIVIAGNHTLLALQWLYKQQADAPQNVQVIDGEWWIQVTDVRHLSDEQAPAYAIAANRTAALANPDMEQLATLLQEVANFDDEMFRATGFDGDALDEMLRELSNGYNSDDEDGLYSRKIEAPIYEPSDKKPSTNDLYNDEKTKSLVFDIQSSDDLTSDEKEFLIIAAQRHTVLNFSKIADYYAHSSEAVQSIMEDSALVIIDFDKAIELGFVKLSNQIAELEASDNG